MSARSHAVFGIAPGAGNRRDNEESRKLLDSMIADAANGTGNAGAEAGPSNTTFLQQTLMNTLVTERKLQRVIAQIIQRLRLPRPSATSPR